ncbi:galactose mutarotase-like domain-containing protein [Rhodotorula diobovata]|uniref:Galactose mutarotase-like domain-containing protein n=1 Tax=Rhodotorula diobovata TaxID=5288 RepID=A0A5C5FN51_9BASI|nr:galactose mutarotase-like domain-containing protein [Rhodotorula diobovata]
MLQRLGSRILGTRVPVPVALPTDPAESVPLTSADQLVLDDLVPGTRHHAQSHRARHPRRSPGHAPLRTLATAVLFPGLLLLASTWALLWALPGPLGSDDPSDHLGGPDAYRNRSNVNVFERFQLTNKDRSARATFIPLGATLVDFWVKDRNGEWRDVVLGYDNTTDYLTDARFPYFGAVVGRVANRIANASYPDPTTHLPVHLSPNEHGRTTLHGGHAGYARSGWRVLSRLADRVEFALADRAGTEGFPAGVDVRAEYALLSDPVRLETRLSARVREGTTPVMLSSHVYWNLDGFQAYGREGEVVGRGTGGRARDHRLWVDADRFLEVDGDLVPTGRVPPIERGSPRDFASVRGGGGGGARVGPTIGERVDVPEARGLCGTGCKGLDTALVLNERRNVTRDPVAVLESPASGIRLSIRTDQPALHLFTTPSAPWGLPHPLGLPRKTAHLPHGKEHPRDATAEERTYPKGGAVAVECEGWVDAVHHVGEEGGWPADPVRCAGSRALSLSLSLLCGQGRKPDGGLTPLPCALPPPLRPRPPQWYTPERPYDWWAEYELTTFDAAAAAE